MPLEYKDRKTTTNSFFSRKASKTHRSKCTDIAILPVEVTDNIKGYIEKSIFSIFNVCLAFKADMEVDGVSLKSGDSWPVTREYATKWLLDLSNKFMERNKILKFL